MCVRGWCVSTCVCVERMKGNNNENNILMVISPTKEKFFWWEAEIVVKQSKWELTEQMFKLEIRVFNKMARGQSSRCGWYLDTTKQVNVNRWCYWSVQLPLLSESFCCLVAPPFSSDTADVVDLVAEFGAVFLFRLPMTGVRCSDGIVKCPVLLFKAFFTEWVCFVISLVMPAWSNIDIHID